MGPPTDRRSDAAARGQKVDRPHFSSDVEVTSKGPQSAATRPRRRNFCLAPSVGRRDSSGVSLVLTRFEVAGDAVAAAAATRPFWSAETD